MWLTRVRVGVEEPVKRQQSEGQVLGLLRGRRRCVERKLEFSNAVSGTYAVGLWRWHGWCAVSGGRVAQFVGVKKCVWWGNNAGCGRDLQYGVGSVKKYEGVKWMMGKVWKVQVLFISYCRYIIHNLVLQYQSVVTSVGGVAGERWCNTVFRIHGHEASALPAPQRTCSIPPMATRQEHTSLGCS